MSTYKFKFNTQIGMMLSFMLLMIFYIFKHLRYYFIFFVCCNESLLHHHSTLCEKEIEDYFEFSYCEHKYLNILKITWTEMNCILIALIYLKFTNQNNPCISCSTLKNIIINKITIFENNY